MEDNKTKTITFSAIPQNLDQLQAMREFSLQDEFEVAALVVAVLCNYERDTEGTLAMVDALRGPEPLNAYGKQFLRDRLSGKQYKTFSFFEGSSPANDYTPTVPYTIRVSSNPYSYQNENYATLYLKSSGADSARPIALRKKPSTGQWFVVDFNFLADIRIPTSQDKWA